MMRIGGEILPGDIALVSPSGAMTSETEVVDLKRWLDSMTESEARGLIIDLSSLTELDSKATGTLRGVMKRMEGKGGACRIVAPIGTQPRGVLDIVRIKCNANIGEATDGIDGDLM